MSNKVAIKHYIRYFRRLAKHNFHGAVGYVNSKEGEISDMEIAARYLSIKGINITSSVNIENDGERTTKLFLG